jgi:hypothetical protein
MTDRTVNAWGWVAIAVSLIVGLSRLYGWTTQDPLARGICANLYGSEWEEGELHLLTGDHYFPNAHWLDNRVHGKTFEAPAYDIRWLLCNNDRAMTPNESGHYRGQIVALPHAQGGKVLQEAEIWPVVRGTPAQRALAASILLRTPAPNEKRCAPSDEGGELRYCSDTEMCTVPIRGEIACENHAGFVD